MQNRLKPYLQALPDIFLYQIVTKIILGFWLFLLGRLFQVLLRSSGRVAVTAGDWKFLFTSWQGILILLLGIVSLFIYVGSDLNCKIVLSRNLVTGDRISLPDSIREGVGSIRKLVNVRGLLVVLYIALAAPILGLGLSITATKGLYIPTFISSVIKDSVLYSALAGAGVVLLLILGIANLFLLHGLIIDDLPIGEASRQSRRLIRDNLSDYIRQNVLFILTLTALIAGTAVLCLFLPLKLLDVLQIPGPLGRLLTIVFVIAGVIASALADLFAMPLYLMKMTQLYYSYKQGRVYEYRGVSEEKHDRLAKCIVALIAAAVIMVPVVYLNFDRLFPENTDVKIIAHRAGGSEAPENTVAGVKAALKAGAYGTEIDIYRTKDGFYVVNHDATFKRVAGDSRKPSDMTLKEIKKLRIDGEPVATLKEMLIACKGKIKLFIELKGGTADTKMADDTIALVRQYKMEDDCVVIGQDYQLIDYVEKTYPEIETGFLTFVSVGKTAKLNCDYIGLEEESSTADAIRTINDEGKKALVWTANEKGSQRHFLCTDAFAIITDNMTQAKEVAKELNKRSDIDRMVDRIKTIM